MMHLKNLFDSMRNYQNGLGKTTLNNGQCLSSLKNIGIK